MRVLRANEVQQLAAATPDEPERLVPSWLEGPFRADRLDVAMVTASPGGAAPLHSHNGGQVIVVTAGEGFMECNGERVRLHPGDVVICPPGELHAHGATEGSSFSHLTVTTGDYFFPPG